MTGFLVTFYTQQDRKHGHTPICEWLLDLARDLKLKGATLTSGVEGFGHDGKIHSAHFIELADQPVQVSLAVSEDECAALFARLEEEDLRIFFIKMPIEMGTSGKAP
ncbi:DUF190 domain-containing protein [Frateuria aurantia]